MDQATPAPQDDYGQEAAYPPPTNALGIIGCIVSVAGVPLVALGAVLGTAGSQPLGMVILMGIPALLGTLLSAAAIHRQPRGYATVGLTLGLCASLLLGVVILRIPTQQPPTLGEPVMRATTPVAPTPRPAASAPAPPGTPLLVSMSATGQVTIDGKPYTDEALRAFLDDAARRRPRPCVELSMYANTPDAEVVHVCQMCDNAHLEYRMGKVISNEPPGDRDEFVRQLLKLGPPKPETTSAQPK